MNLELTFPLFELPPTMAIFMNGVLECYLSATVWDRPCAQNTKITQKT